MNKQVFLTGVAVCGLVNGIYVFADGLDNTKEDTKQIQQPLQYMDSNLNEDPSFKKRRMSIPTGKPKVFSSEKEIAEARAKLQNVVSRSRYALVGSFDQDSKSDFVEHGKYPGGGYYLIDFKIIKYLGEFKKPVNTMKIRVPREFVRVADQNYLREVESTMDQLLEELQSVKREHEIGGITTEELDIYKAKWREKAKTMDYASYFGQRIKYGLNYSFADNTFVLLVNHAIENGVWDERTYVFRLADILPIGYGTFVDVLLPINNSELDLQHEINE
jgi:hypothetical protein